MKKISRLTIEEKWHQQAKAAKDEASKLPHGKEREALIKKARQLETAAHINQWLSSPGLRPPGGGPKTLTTGE